MFFGSVAFSEAAFASQGFDPNAFVNVTGSRINAFVESSAPTFTAFGNAQLSNAQTKFGASSLLLDGTGDYVKSTNSDVVNGNFTVEFFVYASDFSQDAYLWDNQVSNSGLAISITSLNKLRVLKDNTIVLNVNPGFTDAAWNHVALVQSGNFLNIYVNGASRGQFLQTGGVDYSGQPYYIGARHTVADYFNGYIDEFRTSSVARYKSNFTPTTSAFTPDSDTGSLLHFDGTNGSTTITNSVGQLNIIGDANISPTGSSQTIRIGDVSIAFPIDVPVTGNPFRLFVDTNVIVKANADVDATGQGYDIGSGTVDPPDQTIGLSGEELDVDTGDPTIVAKATISPTGSELDVDTGDVTFSFIYSVTGSGVDIDTGDVTTIAKATVLPDGSQVVATSGSVTTTADANVSLNGNVLEVGIGDVNAKANADVTVTTNALDLATGTVTTKVNIRINAQGVGLDVGTNLIRVKQWDSIVPGANQVWVELQPRKGS